MGRGRPQAPGQDSTLSVSDGDLLRGQAFSPDGQILAVAYYDRIFLWDVASPARPRLLRSLDLPVTPSPQAAAGARNEVPFSPQDIAFSPGGSILASATGRQNRTIGTAVRARPTPALGCPDSAAIRPVAPRNGSNGASRSLVTADTRDPPIWAVPRLESVIVVEHQSWAICTRLAIDASLTGTRAGQVLGRALPQVCCPMSALRGEDGMAGGRIRSRRA